jgi:hypothetical protein
MRAVFRFLVCLAISCAIALAVTPAQSAVPIVEKADCCAKVKMGGQANDCGHHAPRSDQDKQCCAGCVFCLAILVRTAPFVYPPTGEESFAAFSMREHVRADRPPVPPPRA